MQLIHLYVHEPLIRDGAPGPEMGEAMETLADDLLPLAAPMMDGLHRRLLRYFVEQDVVGHMEAEAEFDQIGEVTLKGFNEPTELFIARQAAP